MKKSLLKNVKSLSVKSAFIVLSLWVLTLMACRKENDNFLKFDCSGLRPTYNTDVKPILNASCATSGCHNATTKADGKDFSTYSEVKKHTSHKAFLGSMQHLSGYKPMPLGGSKLSDQQLKIISCWIENGAPE